MAISESVRTAVPAGESVRPRRIRAAIGVFGLTMALLTLFSNTLLHLSLPQVAVESPSPGALSHEVRGSGTVEAAETVSLYADTSWPVKRVHVKKGDPVRAGQELVTFDTDEATNALEDERTRHRQKQLAVEKLQESYVEARVNGDERQTRTIARELESAKIDLEIQQRKIRQLEDRLAKCAVLRSPVNGTATDVQAVEGARLPNGGPAVRIEDADKGHQLKAIIDADKAKHLEVGGSIDVVFASLNNAVIRGTIVEIAYPEDGSGSSSGRGDDGSRARASGTASSESKEVTIALKDDRLKGGETGEFTVVRNTNQTRMLVPNEAVQEDDQGAYVYVLKEKEGPLGKEFYAQKARIDVLDADDEKTAVESGLSPIDRVIVSASKPLEDGGRVALAD